MLIDPEHQIVTDQRTQRALSFVIEIESYNNLQALVSEIKVRDDDLIVYMNFGDVVPVIFGSGDLHNKINILESYYEQLGASDLTQQAAYLDLRVEDRVVVKKRV